MWGEMEGMFTYAPLRKYMSWRGGCRRASQKGEGKEALIQHTVTNIYWKQLMCYILPWAPRRQCQCGRRQSSGEERNNTSKCRSCMHLQIVITEGKSKRSEKEQ